jgi:hypothetical protein
VAQRTLTPEEVFQKADYDIKENREMVQLLMEREKIKTPPKSMIDDALAATLAELSGKVAAISGSADE